MDASDTERSLRAEVERLRAELRHNLNNKKMIEESANVIIAMKDAEIANLRRQLMDLQMRHSGTHFAPAKAGHAVNNTM
jgi:hypothetical protein